MSADGIADGRNDIVRVGLKRRNFGYVDAVKRRLHDGEENVTITALGQAISDAVSVVEILKNHDLVVVNKIATFHGHEAGARRSLVDKIEIIVSKSANFDEVFEEQQKQREERKALREAEQDGNGGVTADVQ